MLQALNIALGKGSIEISLGGCELSINATTGRLDGSFCFPIWQHHDKNGGGKVHLFSSSS